MHPLKDHRAVRAPRRRFDSARQSRRHGADDAQSCSRCQHPECVDGRVLRPTCKGRLILAGSFDCASAESALEPGQPDLIAFARPFLANPDLVKRMRADAPLNAVDTATQLKALRRCCSCTAFEWRSASARLSRTAGVMCTRRLRPSAPGESSSQAACPPQRSRPNSCASTRP
jgi:hypothetical protein